MAEGGTGFDDAAKDAKEHAAAGAAWAALSLMGVGLTWRGRRAALLDYHAFEDEIRNGTIDPLLLVILESAIRRAWFRFVAKCLFFFAALATMIYSRTSHGRQVGYSASTTLLFGALTALNIESLVTLYSKSRMYRVAGITSNGRGYPRPTGNKTGGVK